MVRMVDLVKDNDDRKRKSGNPAVPPPKNQDGDMGGVSFVAAASSIGSPAQASPVSKIRKSVLQGTAGGGKSLSTPTSLSAKTKYCPYLGGRKTRSKVIDYPAVSNVCYGEESREKKLLRTIVLPFSLVPAQRQREFCLATFRRCPLFLAQEKEKAENGG